MGKSTINGTSKGFLLANLLFLHGFQLYPELSQRQVAIAKFVVAGRAALVRLADGTDGTDGTMVGLTLW